MAFKNEVFISNDDKQRLVSLINEINEILEKYPYSSDYTHHTVTTMSMAKSHSKDAETWIKLLKTSELN